MKSTLIKYSYLFLLCILALNLKAQPVNTLYFLRGVPQSNQLNPAFQPEANLYLGAPCLSTLQFNLSNNSLVTNDVLYYNSDIDSLITFLHPKGDKAKFLNSLKSTNQLQSDFQLNIADFGFRVNSYYFSFGIAVKNSINISFPKDFARFALELLPDGANYDFSNMHLSELAYTEYSMGVAKTINEKLQLGVRGKILSGIGTFQTSKMEVSLKSSIDQIDINSNTQADISMPNLNVYFDPKDGYPDSTTMDNFTSSTIKKLAFNPKNMGLAIDFGAVYKPIEVISLSASVIDLGRIWWKDNVYNLKQEGSYSFKGVKLDILDDTSKYFDHYIDTLKNNVKISNARSSFSTALATKVFLGAEYNPVKWFSLGLLSRTIFYPTNIFQEFTASAQLHPIRMISTSVSYSFTNNNYSSIGVGLALKTGPFNMYIVSDHIPLYYGKQFIPYKAGMVDFRIGFNLLFGSPNKSKTKERPMMS